MKILAQHVVERVSGAAVTLGSLVTSVAALQAGEVVTALQPLQPGQAPPYLTIRPCPGHGAGLGLLHQSFSSPRCQSYSLPNRLGHHIRATEMMAEPVLSRAFPAQLL